MSFCATRRSWLLHLSILTAALAIFCAAPPSVRAGQVEQLPNILWITCEDIGPHLGCYGDKYAETPNLDRLAAKGVHYRTAWSNAPVCAPARTTIISGVYPTSTGAQHMRSEVEMPSLMKMYPQFLHERGYYCTNNSKTDYNLKTPGKIWDESSGKAHWKNRQPGQPFFAIFNLTITHESQIRTRPHTLKHDPAKVRVPAYHPDTPEVRLDWAQYHDNISTMDGQAGKLLAELEEAGLMDRTIIFFYGDHGSGMPRSKRWPYNSGLQVPLIVYMPEKFKQLTPSDYAVGGVSDRLVAFVDLAPTLLSLAGVQPPEWLQGHAFLGKFVAPPQPYLHGFRGRMDERYDLVRSVRNQRYVYLRQYMPHLIYGQHIAYMFETPTTQVWKRLYDEGKLNAAQKAFWQRKPAEELYDLQSDPDEVRNLVDSPEHQTVLGELRRAQREHVLRIRDVGLLTEAEMHSRAAGTTIYEMGHDPQKYPLEKILAMAEWASSLKPEAIAKLKEGLADQDSAVRYWAAIGLLMRGQTAVAAGGSELRAVLADASPSVRITAAQALGQYGEPADLEPALAVLRQLAPADINGAYVSLLAVNAIDALGSKAASLAETLKTMSKSDPQAASRANGYVARLTQDILQANGQSAGEKQPASDAPRPKKKRAGQKK
jgi:arylsulfatase A-like enzyme